MFWHKLKRRVATGSQATESSAARREPAKPGWRQQLQRTLQQKVRRHLVLRAAGKKTLRDLVSLAWPIAAAMLGETAMGLVDTKLVGDLGPEALGGVGFAVVLMYLSYAIVFGLVRGVKVRVAYAVGEGRPGDAVRYAWAGVLVSAAIGAVVFVICRDATPLLTLLKIDPAIVPHARDFLAARTFGAVFACSLAALNQWRQGIGDSRTPMIVGIGGNVINAVLAWSLIHGHFGLPALGSRGAGYATATTETLEVIVLGVMLVRAWKASPSTLPIRKAVREVISIGGPTGLQFGAETLAFTTFTTVLASFGATAIASHQIALNTIRASFLPGIAIAESASVLIANALAQKRIAQADRITRYALALGVGFMTVCGIVFAIESRDIAGVFTTDEATIALASKLLVIAAIFQAFDAVNIVLRSALRAAKDVRFSMIVGTAIVWLALPGSSVVLGRWLGFGAPGAWCGFILETSLASAILYWRWKRGPWRGVANERLDDGLSPSTA
jgi:MATE family multidrug resistance protein